MTLKPNPYKSVTDVEEDASSGFFKRNCCVFLAGTLPPLAILCVGRIISTRRVSLHALAGVSGEVPTAYGDLFVLNVIIAAAVGMAITLGLARYQHKEKNGPRIFFVLLGALTIQYPIWLFENVAW